MTIIENSLCQMAEEVALGSLSKMEQEQLLVNSTSSISELNASTCSATTHFEEEEEEEEEEEDPSWLDSSVEKGWRQQYMAYSSDLYRHPELLEKGDKIVLPTNALKDMARLAAKFNLTEEAEAMLATGPLTFELKIAGGGGRGIDSQNGSVDSKNKEEATEELTLSTKIYCSVLEFSASDMSMFLPKWMMYSLGNLSNGQVVNVRHLIELPKATYAKFRPVGTNFAQIFENRKNILEAELRHYTVLSVGCSIIIRHKGVEYGFKVTEVKPSNREAVCIVNTDLEVDFEETEDLKDFFNSQYQQHSKAIMSFTGGETEKEKTSPSSSPPFEAFSGKGQQLENESASISDDFCVCTNCDSKVPKASYLLHEAVCFRNVFKCDICSKRMKKTEKDSHMSENHGSVTCQDCKETFDKSKLEYHKLHQCLSRSIDCAFCGVEHTCATIQPHETYCGSRTEECETCHKRITLKDFPLHLESNCHLEDPNTTHHDRRSPLRASLLICPHCSSPFPDPSSLMNHVVEQHDSSETARRMASNLAAAAAAATTSPSSSASVASSSSPPRVISPWVRKQSSLVEEEDLFFCPMCNDPFLGFEELQLHCATQHEETNNEM